MIKRHRIRITSRIFEILMRAIRAQFEKNCQLASEDLPQNKTEAYFGFGWQGRQEKVTLYNKMMDHPGVQRYLNESDLQSCDLSPKYLYKLHLEKEKSIDPHAVIEADRKYLDVYVRFLGDLKKDVTSGFDRFEDFVRSHASIPEEDRRVQLKLLESNRGEVIPDLATYYKGYYRTGDTRTQTFELAIDFINRHGEDCPARLHGFREEKAGAAIQPIVYTGKCKKHASCLLLSLLGGDDAQPLNFIIRTDNVPTQNLPVLISCFQGLSLQGCPFASEAILVKTREGGQSLPLPGRESNIDLYLRLQQHHFTLPAQPHPPLDQLKTTGGFTKEFLHLKGTYRIWNQSSRGVVQSRLTITPDYAIHLETPNALQQQRKQVFTMRISQHQDKKLYFCTPPGQQNPAVNYGIIDLTDPEGDQVYPGVFCTASSGRGMLSGSFVCKKEKTPCEVRKFPEVEFESYVRKDPALGKMVELLKNENSIREGPLETFAV